MASKAKSAVTVVVKQTLATVTAANAVTKPSVTVTEPAIDSNGQYFVENVLTQPSTTPI